MVERSQKCRPTYSRRLILMALVISNRSAKRPELLQLTVPKKKNKDKKKEQKETLVVVKPSKSVARPVIVRAPSAGRPQHQARNTNVAAMKKAVSAVRQLKRTTSSALPAVAQYLDPLHHRPVRIPDVNSAQTIGTAVAALSGSVTLKWDTLDSTATAEWSARPDGTPFLTSPTARFVFRCRDPITPLIVSEFGPSAMALSTYLFPVGVGASSSPSPGNARVAYDGVYLPLSWGYQTGGPTRYPTPIYPAKVNEYCYAIWVDASPTRTALISISAVLTGSGASFELLYWSNPECPATINIISAATAGAYSATFPAVTHSGYFSIRTSATSIIVSESNISVGLTVTTSQWFSAYSFPSYAAVAQSGIIDTVRILGDCLLAQNTSSNYQKSGEVYAVQSQNTDAWFEKPMSFDFISSINVRQYYQGLMAKGLYAIVKPQSANATNPFAMVDAGEEFTGTATYLSSRPFQHSGFVTAVFAPAESVAASSQLQLHFMRSIEFTTDNQMYAVDIPRMPRAHYSRMLDELSRCPQFFENPLHLAAIASLLANIGSWIWTNKTPLFNAIAAAHNAFHRSRDGVPDAD